MSGRTSVKQGLLHHSSPEQTSAVVACKRSKSQQGVEQVLLRTPTLRLIAAGKGRVSVTQGSAYALVDDLIFMCIHAELI